MIYDGIVIKVDELFLFILDPDEDKLLDGINISEHDCYKDLKKNQLMVVKVIFKDGTQEIDNIDLDEFIHGDRYGMYNVFLHIQDILLFSIGEEVLLDIQDVKLEDIIKNGDLENLGKECIEISKKKLQIEN
jgi:hypothetical protein